MKSYLSKILFFTIVISFSSCRKEGTVTFWQNASSNLGVTEVQVDGRTKSITLDYTSTPDCYASGCASFLLDVGSYNYYATDGVWEWNGTVSVTKNGCLTMQLY